MPVKPSVRCFIALDLPSSIKTEALHVQEQLREKNLFHGRFTAPRNIHLTLKFLGEIHSDQVTEVADALRSLATLPFPVQLGDAGTFAPRIIWLKLTGSDTLQQQIDQALASWFPREDRFMGHITIARVKNAPKPHVLAMAVKALKVSPLTARAACFSLRQSILNPEGPRYEVLEQFPLAGT